MERPDPTRMSPGTPVKRPRPFKALVPLLILGAFAVALVLQEVPAARDLYERWTHPTAWQAGQACRKAALGLATQADFARVVARGTVHATQNGFYVEAITIGEMGPQGGETRFLVACYADEVGQVVRADRVEH